jgi:uncharacterized protein (DUF885 family)
LPTRIFMLTLSFLLVLPGVALGSRKKGKTADQKFEELANKFLSEYLELNPEAATQLGEHRYDARLADYSLAGVARQRAFNERYLKALNAIPLKELNTQNGVDYRIMRTQLEGNLFAYDQLREYEWNPLTYNVSGGIYGLLARDFAPLKDRLVSTKGRLDSIPDVCAAAKKNLKNPPKVYTETAILQNKGGISLIRDDLQEFLNQAPEMKAELAPAQAKAIAALEDYGAWLEKDLLPRSNGEFRLGETKFRQKLKYTLDSDLSMEQILRQAEADLKSTQTAMYDVALPLYKTYFPNDTDAARRADRKLVIKTVLNKLAEQRPTNDTIVALARQDLQATTDFVRTHNLVSLPAEQVRAIVMPEYARGVSVAYCDSPGPFEKNAQTFFDISPTPKDWAEQRVNSFFREYNDYMVQDLTIHEAMPGHYLQLAHANKFKAPTMLRAVFPSGPFIEGWAVYAEQLMAEYGYGGPQVRMQQLKMRLRTIVNAIIDQKIHTAGMTEKEAIDLMMNDGFQEEGEATGKWRRAQLSSTQLSTYYVGNLEVNDIRRAYEAKNQGKVDYKRMHDTMLSFGSPPAKYVKELMGL